MPAYRADVTPACTPWVSRDGVPVVRSVTANTRSATAPWTSRTAPRTSSSAASVATARVPSRPGRRLRRDAVAAEVVIASVWSRTRGTSTTRAVAGAGRRTCDVGSGVLGRRRVLGALLGLLHVRLGVRARDRRRVGDRPVRLEVRDVDVVAGGIGDVGGLDDQRERLAADDLGDHLRDVVVLDHVLHELLGVLPRLLRPAHQVLLQLVLVDADVLGLRELVEDELSGDRVADPLLEVGLELVDGLLLRVEVLLHGHAGEAELLLDLLAPGGQLGVDDAVGGRALDEVEELLQDGIAGRGALLEALAPQEPATHVLGEL